MLCYDRKRSTTVEKKRDANDFYFGAQQHCRVGGKDKKTCFLQRSWLRGVINYKLQIYSNQIVNCWSRDIFYEAYFTNISHVSKLLSFFSSASLTLVAFSGDILVLSRLHIAKNELLRASNKRQWPQPHGMNAKQATNKAVLDCQVGFSAFFCFSVSGEIWNSRASVECGETWKFP
jgi:hypothetical protein